MSDKLNLDIFWLKDESLEDSANLPDPDIIAAEIVEDLQAALAQFAEIRVDRGGDRPRVAAGLKLTFLRRGQNGAFILTQARRVTDQR